MSASLTAAWMRFIRPENKEGLVKLLNKPCSTDMLKDAEKNLGVLPEGLRDLLLLSDGQRLTDMGLFKNVSGINVYSRAYFLGIESVVGAYNRLISDSVMVESFGTDLIPFATEGATEFLGYTFAIARDTGSIYMLWTSYTFMNPPDWDLWKIYRAKDMTEFIYHQSLMGF